jgi:glycosyltransferase involved in cell wall biosynthesis
MPDSTKRLLSSNPQYFDGKINVAMWSPDFPKIPSEWISTSRAFDEIWVISEFMRKNVADKLPVPVKRIRYPLLIDEVSIKTAKFREGIPEDVCVFLFAFEYSGGFERKNPIALIEAFKRSFSKSDKALLIIKTMPFFSSSVNPMHTIRVAKLASEKARILRTAVREAANDTNIRIIDDRLTRSEFMSLLASSDCYASMHRAEGYGQVLAQSMYLGKPVIATGYSGNLDYMNKDNSLLLRFELVKVRDRQMYEEGNVWAEPDVDHASQLMRWVYEHSKEAKEIGIRASTSMRDLTNPQTAGNEIREECARLCVNQ